MSKSSPYASLIKKTDRLCAEETKTIDAGSIGTSVRVRLTCRL
jgi:hypothetical protein